MRPFNRTIVELKQGYDGHDHTVEQPLIEPLWN